MTSDSISDAERLVEQGRALDAAGDPAGAERTYRGAIAKSPASR